MNSLGPGIQPIDYLNILGSSGLTAYFVRAFRYFLYTSLNDTITGFEESWRAQERREAPCLRCCRLCRCHCLPARQSSRRNRLRHRRFRRQMCLARIGDWRHQGVQLQEQKLFQRDEDYWLRRRLFRQRWRRYPRLCAHEAEQGRQDHSLWQVDSTFGMS